MLANGSTTALSAVLLALGRDESDGVDTPAARASPNMDAAELVQLLASATPKIGESIMLSESTSIVCSVCQTAKQASESVPLLMVDVAAPRHMTLHGAFKYACEPDQYGDESHPIHECRNCQKLTPAVKRIHPGAPWPDRLLIVLRRYNFDFSSMSTKKVMHRVAFPRQLDLQALCEIPLGSPPPPDYSLVGAVVHTGATTLAGSYSYETNPGTLAALGLDDKMAVQDMMCPGGSTPYILVYSRSSGATSTSISASIASGSVYQGPAAGVGKPAHVQAEEQRDSWRRRPHCCCTLM
jgi:hypothetical protein